MPCVLFSSDFAESTLHVGVLSLQAGVMTIHWEVNMQEGML